MSCVINYAFGEWVEKDGRKRDHSKQKRKERERVQINKGETKRVIGGLEYKGAQARKRTNPSIKVSGSTSLEPQERCTYSITQGTSNATRL